MPKFFFWIETDVEPDDVLALAILAICGNIHTIIFGESPHPSDIAGSGIQVLDKMGTPLDYYSVLRGQSSTKEFVYRGKEHSTSDYSHYLRSDTYSPDEYQFMFKRFVRGALDAGRIPVFVGLKPPRELFDTAHLLKNELKEVVGISYGGFNYRSVCNKDPEREARFLTILSYFKSHTTYESFLATGPNNSVNPISDPQLFAAIAKPTEFWTSFNALMTNWNRALIEDDCYPTCKGLLEAPETIDAVIATLSGMDSEAERIEAVGPLLKDPTQAQRFVLHNLKPLLSIRGYEGKQFLLADACAVVALLDFDIFDKYNERSEISFVNGYTVAVPSSPEKTVNTFCFKNIPRELMVGTLTTELLKIN